MKEFDIVTNNGNRKIALSNINMEMMMISENFFLIRFSFFHILVVPVTILR